MQFHYLTYNLVSANVVQTLLLLYCAYMSSFALFRCWAVAVFFIVHPVLRFTSDSTV